MALAPHDHPLFDDARRPWGPTVDAAAVARFEALYGLRLPPALVAVLQGCNGGRLRRTSLGPLAGRRPLRMRDLAGIGYDEGLEASGRICEEWGYPRPSLVLSTEGPVAGQLDYRRCGAHGDPSVVFVDTDEEVAGRPLEWTVAPSAAALFAQLRPWHPRTVLAVADPDPEAVIDRLMAQPIGAAGPVRDDHEGGRSLSLPGWRGSDDSTARVRVLPWTRPDGARRLPELPARFTLVQSTVAADALDRWLDQVGPALPPGSRLVHRGGA